MPLSFIYMAVDLSVNLHLFIKCISEDGQIVLKFRYFLWIIERLQHFPTLEGSTTASRFTCGYWLTCTKFSVKECSKIDIKPSKIIITGDSAGGNLTAALTSLLIKLRLRVPDGIVLCYPALNLNYDNYTPSLLTCLDEPILPHTFLKICLQSYIQNSAFKPELDPFLSPIHSPDSILK